MGIRESILGVPRSAGRGGGSAEGLGRVGGSALRRGAWHRRGVLIALVAAACSGGTIDPSGATTFCQDYAAAFCDFSIKCGQVSSNGKNDCQAYFQGLFCGTGTQSAKKGYQTFDQAKGKACLDSIKAASCEALTLDVLGQCDGVFTAAATSGGACFLPSDCKDPAQSCGGAACMKTCVATGAKGQPCPRESNCNDGLKCDPTTNTCTTPGAVGDRCDAPYPFQCDPSAECDFLTDTCVALPAVGQACRTQSPRCAGDAFCSNNKCTAKAAVGAACTTFDGCAGSAYCENMVCTARKATGGACTSDAQCDPSLRCIGKACAAPRKVGEACTGLTECEGSAFCDDVLRTCAAITYSLKAGDSCTRYVRNCGSGLRCNGAVAGPPDGGVGTQGTCVARMAGDPCVTLTECIDHTFCQFGADGGGGVCTTSVTGSPCALDKSCLVSDFCGPGAKCTARGNEGATCTGAEQCTRPLTCLRPPTGGDGTCRKLVDQGAACAGADNTGCLFPYLCIGGTCTHAGAQGEPCLNGRLCINGSCKLDAGTCVAPLNGGSDCTFNSDCASGKCIARKCEESCP